ncbi:MAG: hypothetical protein PHR35_13265 [Kiritimatiellae bacterium]|nr:hypothetical protein [Kiritimatiellia bacterium]
MQLRQWTILLGILALAVGVPLLAAPVPAARCWRALPRHRWAGRILSAAALLWAGWLVYDAPLEFLIPFRRYILPAAAIAVPLTWMATPDLLACRALGGLLALLPAPVLVVARSHPSSWRLLVVTWMYLWAIAGMWLMMSPYRLRDWIEAVTRTPQRQRLCGAAFTAMGALLTGLALSVF